MNYKYLLLFSAILSLFSCKSDALKATIPAYITIEDIQLETKSAIQGSSRDNITDAWVYINDRLIGSYELPATIPVIKTGVVHVQIRAGIYNNGISNDRVRYPFYTFFDTTINLVPEKEILLEPVVNYDENAIFDSPWSGEDFEGGVNFEQNPKNDKDLVRSTINDIYEGVASGYVKLENEDTFFELYTPTFSTIPRNGTAVFLEMDYKCTHDIVVSIYYDGLNNQESVINLRSKVVWNKIYIDLTNVLKTLSTAINYRVAIGFKKPVGEIGELNLDNVKLIHY
jgi:hypothetical protein